MKAINISKPDSSSPAPKEWRDIPEIKAQRPKGFAEDSLNRIPNTNCCVWMANKGGGRWYPESDVFLVLV